MKPASFISKYTPALVALCVGSTMWIFAGAKLADPNNNRFEFRPNILAIKGSPIGKTLALSIQGDIDFAWHEGASNPYEAHDHSNCDHDHGVCNHEDEHHDHHGDCDHDHGVCKHDHDSSEELASSDSWLRKRIDRMTASVYASNSPYELTERHRKHIRENVEKKIEFAYSLDPENYFNYTALHFFYETNLGNDVKSADKLIELSKKTRAGIREYTADPEPWLTAAATQGNICDVLTNYVGLEGKEQEFVNHLNDMRDCIIRFEMLRQEKIKVGNWKKTAEARRIQMLDRFFSLVRHHSNLYETYGRLTNSSTSPAPMPPIQVQHRPTS